MTEKLQEYRELMQSVSEFAGRIGLNPQNLYRDSYHPVEPEYTITVSWKNKLSNRGILCDPERVDPETRFRLEFFFVTGSKREIEQYKKRTERVGAEYFTRQIISKDGFVEPSPSFLNLGRVKQVEYALHEAFHLTNKHDIHGEVDHYTIPSIEEACAMIAGHLGAVNYFQGKSEENEATLHWQRHLDLANKVCQFYSRLDKIYSSDELSNDQKLKEREKVFLEAKESFRDELRSPINNAFFRYWNHFYGEVPFFNDRVSGLENIVDIIKRLRGMRL